MRLFEGTEFFQPQHCERCEKLEDDCACPPLEKPKQLVDPGKQTAGIAREKRKKGKVVTVISGLAAADNDLPDLLTKLKNHCGAGGAIKDGRVEIQGDHQERIADKLASMGYKTR